MIARNATVFAKHLLNESKKFYSFATRVIRAKDVVFGAVLKVNDLGIDPRENYRDMVSQLTKLELPYGTYDVFELIPCVFGPIVTDSKDPTLSYTEVIGNPHISSLRVDYSKESISPIEGTGGSMVMMTRKSPATMNYDNAISKSGHRIIKEAFKAPSSFHSTQGIYSRLFLPKDFEVGKGGASKYFVFINALYSKVTTEQLISRLRWFSSKSDKCLSDSSSLKKSVTEAELALFSTYDRQESSCGHFTHFIYTGKIPAQSGLEPQEALLATICDTMHHPDPKIREEASNNFLRISTILEMGMLGEDYSARIADISKKDDSPTPLR